jgi:hypothetical protein
MSADEMMAGSNLSGESSTLQYKDGDARFALWTRDTRNTERKLAVDDYRCHGPGRPRDPA